MNLVEILRLDTRNPKTHGWYVNEWENIKKYPLFISFPRTGAHWINAVMELYFDRPRLPHRRTTLLDSKRDDWMWFHDHDTIAYDKLYVEDQEALYLYRDPIDTVYSYIIYQFNNGKNIASMNSKILGDLVSACSQHYKKHLQKWVLSKTLIKHENFKIDRSSEFKKICDHFEVEFDEEKVSCCFDLVTPEVLTELRTEDNALSNFMLSRQYKNDRNAFKEKYGDKINSIVITGDLKEYFV
tara:strand:+ start:70 stop:792 length:723 start_codon:yes stop_codon:yes gene_type:complete